MDFTAGKYRAFIQTSFKDFDDTSKDINSNSIIFTKYSDKDFLPITWKYELNDIDGSHIWTEDDDIYYSFSFSGNRFIHLVFNKTTKTWSDKKWYGLTNNGLWGQNIWTDGDYTYFSSGGSGGGQLYKYKGSNTWYRKYWNIEIHGRYSSDSIYGKDVWTDGTNIYYSHSDSYGSNQFIYNKNIHDWENKDWRPEGSTGSYYLPTLGQYVWTDGIDTYFTQGRTIILNKNTNTWDLVTWNGDFYPSNGDRIWRKGNNTYYDNTHIFNKSTNSWDPINWIGDYDYINQNEAAFDGRFVWTDGENFYFSHPMCYAPSYNNQYILNNITNQWEQKNWGYTGVEEYINGQYIWTDGTNIYASHYSGMQYVLNQQNSTWYCKRWYDNNHYISDLLSYNGFCGYNIWTDGENTYLSLNSSAHYILHKNTGEWERKTTWSGPGSGQDIWSDGENFYYSYYSTHYILNKNTDQWETKTWDRQFNGQNVWTDGENTYYSENNKQWILNENTKQWETKSWNNPPVGTIWTDEENIYCDRTKVLDKNINDFKEKTWVNFPPTFFPWYDNSGNVYSSYNNTDYIKNKYKNPVI